MKKLSLFSLVAILLSSCAAYLNVHATEVNDFAFTDLRVSQFNSHVLKYEETSRGVRVTKTEDILSQSPIDVYIRFDGLLDLHEVNVKTNKYLAIRYRSNFDPKFALRILTTTGNQNWNNFLFSSGPASIQNDMGSWHTYVYNLSFDNSSNFTPEDYASWEGGDYKALSLNVTDPTANFVLDESYLYLSSFAFFDNEEDAKKYGGLDYASHEDDKGPEITIPFGDGTTFTTTACKHYDFIATAYDEYDDVSSEIEGVLSDGAVDENDKLVEGNHTVTFTATDLSGNESTKTLNLVVNAKDEVAPVINCNLETIYVPIGTYNCLSFTAHDEVDGDIECEYQYSANSVDENNRFIEGTHTLSVTATDLTGNVASKNITIIVSNDFNPNNLEVINEEK